MSVENTLNQQNTPEPLLKILTELREAFQRHYGDRLLQLILFGSQARGDADPTESDIDVLVVLTHPVNASLEIAETGDLLSEIGLRYTTLVSCVFMGQERFFTGGSPFLINVRREGLRFDNLHRTKEVA